MYRNKATGETTGKMINTQDGQNNDTLYQTITGLDGACGAITPGKVRLTLSGYTINAGSKTSDASVVISFNGKNIATFYNPKGGYINLNVEPGLGIEKIGPPFMNPNEWAEFSLDIPCGFFDGADSGNLNFGFFSGMDDWQIRGISIPNKCIFG
jgi:hypothetical protein